jgi:hypothetical protein
VPMLRPFIDRKAEKKPGHVRQKFAMAVIPPRASRWPTPRGDQMLQPTERVARALLVLALPS